jgi:hypothetical protein
MCVGVGAANNPRTSPGFVSFKYSIHPARVLPMTIFARLDTLQSAHFVIVRTGQMPQTMLTLRFNHSDHASKSAHQWLDLVDMYS